MAGLRAPPYLPFVVGPPRFAVGLRPIPADSWLDPDTEIHAIPEKRALIGERLEEVYAQTPGSEAAQSEAAALIAAARGASARTLVEAGLLVSDDLCIMQDARAARSSPGRGSEQTVSNRPVSDPSGALAAGSSEDVGDAAGAGEAHREDARADAAPRAAATDSAGVESEASWRLTAALLCAPSLWRLGDNIGGPLSHLHAPVPDRLGPDGGPGLAPRIARVFDALAPGVILERFNWTIQAGGDRFAPHAAPLMARAQSADPRDAATLLHLRVERQTIRKLPETGAVLFTIRVCIDPLAAACADPAAIAAFAQAWRLAPAHVRIYKNWASLEPLVEAFLTH